jgi:anti-sigma factor RsiW
MNNDTQLKVQAYLDNELSPGEARQVASLISTDGAIHELYTELKETKEILAENEPILKLQESRDFYWSQIQRGINASERRVSPQKTKAWWVRMLVPAAGALALFAILFVTANPGGPSVPTAQNTVNSTTPRPLHEVEDLAPDVSSITFRSEAEGVTVVWVTSQ